MLPFLPDPHWSPAVKGADTGTPLPACGGRMEALGEAGRLVTLGIEGSGHTRVVWWLGWPCSWE